MEYTCPHHPEIRQNTPGICPKCGGMKLVPLSTLEKNSPEHEELGKTSWKDYIPLFVIIGLIALTTGVLTLKDVETGTYSLEKTISYFMIGFFLTFAGFKLLDLRGFAKGYSTYDLLAQRVPAYGYVYPFIELAFGLGMILFPASRSLLVAEILVMGFSGLGVAIKLAKKEKFHCACLGTLLKVPLTKITIVEDFGMAFLALILLLLH